MLVVSDILTEPDIDPDTANYRCLSVTGALAVVTGAVLHLHLLP